jgi:hypothetical protein
VFYRHAGENRHPDPEGFENPGFWVVLPIARLPGMTFIYAANFWVRTLGFLEDDVCVVMDAVLI